MYIKGAFAVPHPPLILPEIGRGEEKQIQDTIDGYGEIARRICAMRPETVVLSSPHAPMYADYFHISSGRGYTDDMRRFRAPGLSINVQYDDEFVQAIADNATMLDFPAGTLGGENGPDHATFIPLYFLNQAYTDYKLVRTGLSGLSLAEHHRFGELIAGTSEQLGRRTVFIASGDLSHKLKSDGPYGYAKQGPVFDQQIVDLFQRGNLSGILSMDPELYEPAAECGLRSFAIMAGVLHELAVTPEVFSYQGTFGVGYATAAFTVHES